MGCEAQLTGAQIRMGNSRELSGRNVGEIPEGISRGKCMAEMAGSPCMITSF